MIAFLLKGYVTDVGIWIITWDDFYKAFKGKVQDEIDIYL
jgi:hypothetical protein